MDLGLSGKVALVAGASKGLGFGVARALAREGARVSLCGRDGSAAEEAARKLTADTGAEVIGAACDVRDGASISAWIAQSVAKWGRVDALLVNGGGPPAGYFRDFDDAVWQDAFTLLILSAVRLIRGVLPHMHSGGALLTVTSYTLREPASRLTLSTVMRAGVAGLVKTLSDELAPNSIRINNLIPGRIETDRSTALDKNTAAQRGTTFEAVRAESMSQIPLKRLGTTEEFGAAAAFLLSPAASYITGESLRVDGGLMRSI